MIFGKIGRAYAEAVDRFALDHKVASVRFGKGDCKEDVAREHFERAERDGRFGVVLIGVAQEKAYVRRGWRDDGHDAHPPFEFGRQAVFVNHFYFYIRDRECGTSFVKTNAYAPYPVTEYVTSSIDRCAGIGSSVALSEARATPAHLPAPTGPMSLTGGASASPEPPGRHQTRASGADAIDERTAIRTPNGKPARTRSGAATSIELAGRTRSSKYDRTATPCSWVRASRRISSTTSKCSWISPSI